MKKVLFFTFGPNNAYFFSSPSSYRQVNFDGEKTLSRSSADKVWRKWLARSPQTNLGWELYMNSQREIRQEYEHSLAKECPDLCAWLKDRRYAPRRVVFGPERITYSPNITVKYSYVAWVPHAQHLCSPYAPQPVQELCKSAEFTYTHVRLVALGVNDSWIIIWENGVVRWDLKDCYPALNDILETYKEKGDQISHVALNASQAGDYFIYMDSENQAIFQVSETFGGDLEQMLKREEVSCKATLRRNDIDAAPPAMFAAPKHRFPAPHHIVASPIYRAFHRRLMAGNLMRRLKKGFAVISSLFSIGASIAGLASCNVM